jgi:hypothetical protein
MPILSCASAVFGILTCLCLTAALVNAFDCSVDPDGTICSKSQLDINVGNPFELMAVAK